MSEYLNHRKPLMSNASKETFKLGCKKVLKDIFVVGLSCLLGFVYTRINADALPFHIILCILLSGIIISILLNFFAAFSDKKKNTIGTLYINKGEEKDLYRFDVGENLDKIDTMSEIRLDVKVEK